FRWAHHKLQILRGRPTIHSYAEFVEAQQALIETADDSSYPCIIHAWDNTPRSGANGVLLDGATPQLFHRLLASAISSLKDRPPERRLLFLKSWNEWAEGNHLEPDLKFGTEFLEIIGDLLGVVPTSKGPSRK